MWCDWEMKRRMKDLTKAKGRKIYNAPIKTKLRKLWKKMNGGRQKGHKQRARNWQPNRRGKETKKEQVKQTRRQVSSKRNQKRGCGKGQCKEQTRNKSKNKLKAIIKVTNTGLKDGKG